MTCQGKGFSISILLHLLGLMLISSLSAVDTGMKTIVMDFNIMTGAAPRQTVPPRIKRHTAPKQRRPNVERKLHEPKEEPVFDMNEQEEPAAKEIIQEPVKEQILHESFEEQMDGPAANDTSSDEANSASADPEGDYIHAQFDFIREAVQRNLAYPQLARRMGWAGKVTVSFIICTDGRARKIEIVKSSGFPVLDRDALRTIRKSLPFPVPPVEAKVILPVVYRLN